MSDPRLTSFYSDFLIPKEDIELGDPYLYEYARDNNNQFYTDNNGNYYMISPTKNVDLYKDWINPNMYSQGYNDKYSPKNHTIEELDKIGNLTKVEPRGRNGFLPKKDYINNRKVAMQKIPALMNHIDELSQKYGIDKNLLAHRLAKEGYIDRIISSYNDWIYPDEQKDFFENVNNEYSVVDEGSSFRGFDNFGLDDFPQLVDSGKIKIPDTLNVKREKTKYQATNEKGRNLGEYQYYFYSPKDAVEAVALQMKYYQDLMKKKGFPNDKVSLETMTNAAYNMGPNHKDLNNYEYINRNYTIKDDYFSNQKANGGKLTKYSELSDRDRWAVIRAGVKAGYNSIDDIEKAYNEYAEGGNINDPILKGREPKAEFYQRVLDPNRNTIKDWESDNVATHKMSYAIEGDKAIVYPEVQNINGKLVDFTRPPYDKWTGYESAIQRGDTIQMTPKEAEYWTKNYKNFYHNFAKDGYLNKNI